MSPYYESRFRQVYDSVTNIAKQVFNDRQIMVGAAVIKNRIVFIRLH